MTHTPVLDSFRLDGKIALVTGGARGLGLTMATALAEAGADVALSGRSLGPAEEAASAIAKATGRRAKAFAADVTSATDVERMAAAVESVLGPIDVLVNNAGVNIRGTVESVDRSRLGQRHRHQPQGAVSLRPGHRPRHGQARLGPRRQSRLDPRCRGARRPGAYASSKAGVINLAGCSRSSGRGPA